MRRTVLAALLAIRIVSWPANDALAANRCPALAQETSIGALLSCLSAVTARADSLRSAGGLLETCRCRQARVAGADQAI